MPTLGLTHITQRYRKQMVFADVSEEFSSGVHLLTGPSGAGKSTLLRLCATVERPAAGTVRWNGTPLPKARRALRRVLGYAPQSVDLPLDLTAHEFLAHMAALKGLARAKAQSQALLEGLGLARDGTKKIVAYSGGMRRRLVLAQALLGAPELLVLDEPTAELDEATAAHVAALLAEQSSDAVVLLTTHLRSHFAEVPLSGVYEVADGSFRALE